MNKEKASFDLWINQHLEEREQRLSKDNLYVWHQPTANDLLPSSI